jgi:hypothetical protein
MHLPSDPADNPIAKYSRPKSRKCITATLKVQCGNLVSKKRTILASLESDCSDVSGETQCQLSAGVEEMHNQTDLP